MKTLTREWLAKFVGDHGGSLLELARRFNMNSPISIINLIRQGETRFFYQGHTRVINLKKNDSVLFRLPPMSVGTSGTGLVVQTSQHTIDDPPDPDTEPGTPHVDWYEVRTLHVDLLHDKTKVQTTNKVVIVDPPLEKALQMRTDSLWHDDLWRLRVTRDSQDSVRDSRMYRIIVKYPSQLPELERRIPLKFFQRGFENNWNNQGLVEAFFDGSNFVIKFRDDFAEMYHKDPITIPLPDSLEIKGFETKANLGIGAGPRPKGPQGSGNSVFVSLLVEISNGGIKVAVPLFPDAHIPLPRSQLTIRFYLHQGDPNSASIQFEPVVDRDVGFFDPPVLQPIEPAVLDKMDELMLSFADRVEEILTELNGSVHFSVLDKWVKPWLVGGLAEPGRMPFHLLRMRYESGPDDRTDSRGIIKPATGNLVITIIGRRDNPGDIHNTQDNDGSIPLFDNIGREEQIHVLPMEGLPLPTDPIFQRLYKIDHIVVLMQENRSFDQVLGYLRREKIKVEVNGLLPDDEPGHKEQVNKFNNKEFFPQKAEVYVSREQQERDFPTWIRPTAWPHDSLDDPGHNADAVADQINGGEDGGPGKMKGFVSTFARRIGEGNHFFLRQVMDYFNASDLWVYEWIRSQFGICDNWFASFAGGTLPNRFVALTGKLNRDKFGNIEEDNPDIEGGNASPIHTPTLFDYLTLHGRTWRVYVHGYGTIQLFAKYTFDITNVLMFNDREQGFEAAAEAGTLPDVTWIEPDYIELPPGNDDHAPADMAAGQSLVERIVNALMKSPNWNKTLLIITYDEHGGFYDHVTPPVNDPPLGDSRRTMGPRVPTFVVSPLIRPGQVFHQRFDHTTIGATILRRFCRQQPKVSERQDNAPDLSSVLELADAPLQRTDFGILGSTKPQLEPGPRIGPSIPSDNSTLFSFNTNAKKEDFHWYLRNISLFTGLGGDPLSFNPRSLRGWLMLNGLDAGQGMRSIMSSFSVSSIKQLIEIRT